MQKLLIFHTYYVAHWGCFLTGQVTLQPVQPLLQPLTFDGVAATRDKGKREEREFSLLHFLMTFLALNPATLDKVDNSRIKRQAVCCGF